MKKLSRPCDVSLILVIAAVILSLSWLLGQIGRAEAVEAPLARPAAIDLTGVVQAVFALLCALVTHRLIPWIKANTAQKQQAMLRAAVDTAVYAAQQLYKTGVVQDRLEYAEAWLGDRGYTVDRAQIEAAVRRMDSMGLTIEEGVLLDADP